MAAGSFARVSAVDRGNKDRSRGFAAENIPGYNASTMTNERTDGAEQPPIPLTHKDVSPSQNAPESKEVINTYRSLVEGIQVYAIFMVDEDGVIITWNPGVERVLGWTREEFIGQHIRILFTDADQLAGVPEEEMARAATEGMAEVEHWHVRKDGSRFYATGVFHALYDEKGKVQSFAKVMGDITDRHEEEVRMQRQAALIDLSLDAIFVKDGSNNRITFWSRGAELTYGWTCEEAEGKDCYELLKTVFPQPASEIMAELEASGRWEGDLIHTRKDGRRIVVASRWALQKNGMTVVLEVNRDVTAERLRQAEQNRFAREQRQIAEALQQSLLIAPPPDIYPGVTIKALYHGAKDDLLVGGDFFDIYAVADNQIAMVVGDATGKGLEAATFTAEIKFVLRAYLREYPSPAVALERLNDFIVDKDRLDPVHLGQVYVAASVVVLDTSTGQLSASVAGMETPLIVGPAGKATRLATGGMLLGVAPRTSYDSIKAHLGEEDTLVISTDGLTEARHPSRRQDFYGVERLTRAIRLETRRHASLAETGQAVLDRVRRFAGGSVSDDVCLLLARRVSRA